MLNGCAELVYTYKLYLQHILAMKYFWQNEAIMAGCVPGNCLLKPHTMASRWNDPMERRVFGRTKPIIAVLIFVDENGGGPAVHLLKRQQRTEKGLIPWRRIHQWRSARGAPQPKTTRTPHGAAQA